MLVSHEIFKLSKSFCVEKEVVNHNSRALKNEMKYLEICAFKKDYNLEETKL